MSLEAYCYNAFVNMFLNVSGKSKVNEVLK